MKKAHRLLSLAPAALLVLGATLSSSVHAAATWYSSGCSSTRLNNGTGSGNVTAGTNVGSGSYVGNTCALSSALDGTLTVTAYSNTQGSAGSPNDGTAIAGGKFETAQLMGYDGGFGIKNRGVDGRDLNEAGEPEHAIDNDGYTDGLLLSFTESTVLRSLTMGYTHTDADVAVLAYTGNGAPVLGGKTAGELLSNGWTLVSSSSSSGTGTRSFNAGAIDVAVSSSYWFVSAYNQGYTGASGAGANDHFKLSAFSGERGPSGDNDVPEPGVLALAGLALVGASRARRRQA